jgi:protein involved in polysaccharide export with SLBB domain
VIDRFATPVSFASSTFSVFGWGGLLILLCTAGVGGTPAHAQQQEVPDSVREDLEARNLSPEQARRRAQQLGLDLSSPEQAAEQARRRGIPEARVRALLRAARADSTTTAPPPSLSASDVAATGVAPSDTTSPAPLAPDTIADDEPPGPEPGALSYFGYDTFDSVPDAFAPTATGPVDDSYVVGPGDELRLVVWGAPEFQYDLTVDRQGRVFVPDHGQFTAAGKTIDALRADMKQWLAQQHAGLTETPPTVFMDLSVTRLRPLKVFVLGEVAQPGGYTVSATANAFNALYSVGGPLRRGTLRRIQVVRDGSVADTVDLYDYLTEGGQPTPVNLQSGDYIRVPVRGKTVAITGAVGRPAYYEMTDGETVRDLIEYAGGVEPNAYGADFEVRRLVPPGEREDAGASVPRRDLNFSLDAVLDGSETVSLSDADRVHIRAVPNRSDPAAASNVASAAVSGAVYQPGTYALGDSVRTVRDLLRAANGPTDDAYRPHATLLRFDADLGEAVRSIHVDSALAGVPRADVPLVPGDSLHVRSVQSLEATRTVRITGQVRNPGPYPYRRNMTVQDLLLRGGGLADSTYLNDVLRSRADLYRETQDGRAERVRPFNLARALNGRGMADEPLQPGDRIRIYPLRAEVNPDKFVEISGAVKEPGRYDYQENLSVKDVILKANGFEEDVYLDELQIARPKEGEPGMQTLRVPLDRSPGASAPVRFAADDTTHALQAAATVPVQHRDRVLVRSDPEYSERDFVTLRGEVRFPGDYALNEQDEPLSSVLERAGGVTPNGYPGGGQLVRDEERFVLDLQRVLRGDEDLGLRDGDEIVIPTTPNSVSVRGNVAQEGRIKYQEGADVDYYLERAGGVRDSTKNIYLTQATGETRKVESGWFARSPSVTDGAVIRVTKESPPPDDPDGVDIGKTVRDVTGILSSALTIIVLATRAFD